MSMMPWTARKLLWNPEPMGKTFGRICLEAFDTNPNDFGVISKGLEDEGYEINGEIGLIPINSVKVGGSDIKQLIELIETLEEHEDIQKVYSNFDFDESEMTSLL